MHDRAIWRGSCMVASGRLIIGRYVLRQAAQILRLAPEKPAFVAGRWLAYTLSYRREQAPGRPGGGRNSSALCNRYCAGHRYSICGTSRHPIVCAALRAVADCENPGTHPAVAAAEPQSPQIRKYLEATCRVLLAGIIVP